MIAPLAALLVAVTAAPAPAASLPAAGGWLAAPATAAVGTPFRLSLRATYPETLTAGTPWSLPLPAGARVLGAVPATDASEAPGRLVRDLLVVLEQPAFAQFGPLELRLYDAAGAVVGLVEVAPVFVEAPAGAARAEMLRPDKGLRRMPWLPPWREIVAVVVLVAAVLAGRALWRRRSAPRSAPVDPFDELAAALLPWREASRRGCPLDREAAFALSTALRRLIERATPIAALEMTGVELSAAVDRAAPGLPRAVTWAALARHVLDLEDIKYLPAHATADLGLWLDPIEEWAHSLREAAPGASP